MLIFGILLPYYSDEIIPFFFFHEQLSFFIISFFLSSFIYFIFKVRYIDVVISQSLFFLTIFIFYNMLLYSDHISEDYSRRIIALFCRFDIVYKKKDSLSLFSPQYNYPVGIFILTIKNATVQSVSYYIIKRIRDMISANSF